MTDRTYEVNPGEAPTAPRADITVGRDPAGSRPTS